MHMMVIECVWAERSWKQVPERNAGDVVQKETVKKPEGRYSISLS